MKMTFYFNTQKSTLKIKMLLPLYSAGVCTLASPPSKVSSLVKPDVLTWCTLLFLLCRDQSGEPAPNPDKEGNNAAP